MTFSHSLPFSRTEGVISPLPELKRSQSSCWHNETPFTVQCIGEPTGLASGVVLRASIAFLSGARPQRLRKHQEQNKRPTPRNLAFRRATRALSKMCFGIPKTAGLGYIGDAGGSR